VVSYLTEELVAQGHDVTLFASGDSLTSARLISSCDSAFRLNTGIKEPLPYQVMQLEQVRRHAHEFDVLHFHTDLMHFPLVHDLADRALTTLHGRLDLPDLLPFFTLFADPPLVSISQAQRLPMPPVNWLGTVPHGLPRDLLPFSPVASGGYLAFLGRIAPEKRPDRAISIAERTGLPLKIAAKVDKVDEAYWQDVIAPMVKRCSQVEFVGEIDESRKAEFLHGALALLFPIDWPEPFGLVMLEAMACGTPVIAFRAGSVPEVIEDGVSGFIVDDIDEAVRAVGRLAALARRDVRSAFEARFTADRMARDYVCLYERLCARKTPLNVPRRSGYDRVWPSLGHPHASSEIVARPKPTGPALGSQQRAQPGVDTAVASQQADAARVQNAD
jgi:glycosyltransferase involved in cell wall biosynthesis